ncbi:hypothetical protein QLX67_08825, partial [Balneolaceae bacterium ANBcel3]|nr:hypothetical protein [Balneolaceae bacterium ANBcel3]
MKRFLFIIVHLILCIFFLTTACSTSKSTLSEVDSAFIPEWYHTPPEDPAFILATGKATSESLQGALEEARYLSGEQIRNQLENRFRALLKHVTERAGMPKEETLHTVE